jgi:hypothetical protein
MDKKGKSLQSTYKGAVQKSSVTTKPDKFDKPSAGDKVILALLRTFKGKKKKKKPLTTQRNKDISSQLRKAGIDQATIDRMRGKKKS